MSANGMWTRMGASGSSVVIAPKTISKEMEERMRVCIEAFMKKAKPDQAKSLKLVRQHVEKSLSLSLTHHKDVLKRLMHGILQRGQAVTTQPEVPVRPEITIAKTKATWWKQDERREALLMGSHRLFQFAVEHPECGLDAIQTFCDLSSIMNDPELHQLLTAFARQLGSGYVDQDLLPEWTLHTQPSPLQVLDCVSSMYTLERIGVQHSRSADLRSFLDHGSSLYSPEDYFGWNPALGVPSSDPEQSGFQKMSNALTLLSYAYTLNISLGCTYASVLHWLPSFYPYQGPSTMDETDYLDQCYLVCRSILTLTNWGSFELAVDLMPNEYYFLQAHLDVQIGRGDCHLIGEFTRALKCFGASVDRGVAFALCYPHSFVQVAHESPDQVVHKAAVALHALTEPQFNGYAPAIPDAQVLAILQRNASTEQQRRVENSATFESDLKRSQMKQALRKLLDKAATMDVKLIPLDDTLHRIQLTLESTTDVKALDATLAMAMLQDLNAMKLTMETLKETGLGRSVNKLRKHPSDQVAAASQALVAKWKKEMLGQ
ncbi:hypothetical protein H257_00674 [Aphanomyces astaci]|uniref:TFIIS N-terminal domain-containing protein n=1 Tax=Aphanomyces astaci TaxID=112090 RepID=W4HCP8_APHAT|nr:hypothetical protein H257_00674 [Aphanomyces astaci]ETV89366.1 hypothetical protein H257_00674 [Aphanomyces astaci]|eukprot:XP_009821766.1 hypothetical protein H257_00674 [Aphanomyces astaci]